MGELGNMSSGFPNQPGEFCTSTFVPDPQQGPYPSCSNPIQYYPPQQEIDMNTSQWGQPFQYDNQLRAELHIIEEPINKIRFRYQSERGSHGSMTGRRNNTTQKSWPTVKLVNYPDDGNGGVKIRASLFTEDKVKPHVHKLLGKNCDKETGDCLLLLTADMTCSFPSLGVLFTEKKRVPEVLFERKCKAPEKMTTEDKRILFEEAKQEAKDMKLNSIRICFEAFNNNNEPITDPVFSEPVHNLKSPDSGELKITRLSRVTSRSEGGDEIFLLCEKVNKKDIKVRFYQQEDGQETWEAFGKFTDADVHHQVAIVFKTPPYRDCNIDKPVKVWVQLYRKNDGETSDPVEFTYKPRDKDPEMIQQKKRRRSDPDNDFKDFGSLDPSFMGHPPNQYGPPGSGHGSWTDGSSQSGYPMMPTHGGHNYQVNNMARFVEQFTSELHMSYSSPSSSSLSVQSDIGTPSTEPATPVEAEMTPEVAPAPCVSLDRFTNCGATLEVLDPTVSPSHFVETESSSSIPYENHPLFDLDSAQKAEIIFTSSDSVESKLSGLKLSDPDSADTKSPKKQSVRARKSSKTSEAVKKPKEQAKARPKSKSFTSGAEYAPTDAQVKVNITSTDETTRSRESSKRGSAAIRARFDARTRPIIEHFIKTRLIPRFAWALRVFTTTGNVQYLLWPMAPFVASQNEDGDNAMHLAVIHQSGNNWLFQQLMPIVSSLMSDNVINHTNNLYQTPLHLAVEVEEVNVVKWLLVSGADPNVQDRRGNTPIHLAVIKNNVPCLTILLQKANYKIHSPEQPLPNCNILNYEGHSALHLCVLLGDLSCLTLLLDAGAEVNVQVGTSGRTALHLAVEMQSPLTDELLKQPSLKVDARDYSGNTALHIACSMESCDMVYALMKADADPLVENCVYAADDVDQEQLQESVDEEEDGPHDEEQEKPHDEQFIGQTPIAISSGNAQLLSILNNTLSVEEDSRYKQARRRSREDPPVPKSERSSPRPSSGPSDVHHRPSSDHTSSSLSSMTMSSDAGYGTCTSSETMSTHEETSEERLEKGLCELLDPPRKDWEKLAYIVYEDTMLDTLRKLEPSPTKILLQKIRDKKQHLEFVLEAAGLPEALAYLQEFHKKALNI